MLIFNGHFLNQFYPISSFIQDTLHPCVSFRLILLYIAEEFPPYLRLWQLAGVIVTNLEPITIPAKFRYISLFIVILTMGDLSLSRP